MLFAMPMVTGCVMIAAGRRVAVRQKLRAKGPKTASSLAPETAPAIRGKDPKTALVMALHPARNRECRMEPAPEWAVREIGEMAGMGNPEEGDVGKRQTTEPLNSCLYDSLSIGKDRPML
jgi:hypothetical protein